MPIEIFLFWFQSTFLPKLSNFVYWFVVIPVFFRLAANPGYVSLKHQDDKVIVFERAGVLFVFNFHPVKSFADYRVGVEESGEYHIILNSDEKIFGGFDRIDTSVKFKTAPEGHCGRRNYLQVN